MLKTLQILRLCGTALCLSLLQPMDGASNLIERSPFAPPKSEETTPRIAPPQPNDFPKVDFVGYSGSDGDWDVAIHFLEQNQVHWMRPGETIESVKLVSFDPANGAINLQSDRNTKTLRLNDSKPAAMDALPPSFIPTLNQNEQPQLPSSIQNNDNSNTNRRVIPRRRVILPRSTDNNSSSSTGSESNQSNRSINSNSNNSAQATAEDSRNQMNSSTKAQFTQRLNKRPNAMIPRNRPVPPRQ